MRGWSSRMDEFDWSGCARGKRESACRSPSKPKKLARSIGRRCGGLQPELRLNHQHKSPFLQTTSPLCWPFWELSLTRTHAIAGPSLDLPPLFQGHVWPGLHPVSVPQCAQAGESLRTASHLRHDNEDRKATHKARRRVPSFLSSSTKFTSQQFHSRLREYSLHAPTTPIPRCTHVTWSWSHTKAVANASVGS